MNISEFKWIDCILLNVERSPITSTCNNSHKQLRFAQLLACYIYTCDLEKNSFLKFLNSFLLLPIEERCVTLL